MSADPDLLVIAETADELAGRFAAHSGSHGLRVERLDYRSAAGRLSVRQDGHRPEVRPGCPIFLRAPAAPPAGASQLTAFHHAEIRGLVWAAGALTDAPVINRPTGDGFAGRFSQAGAVLRRRVSLPARDEVFVSHASALGSSETDWWFEHRGSYAGSPANAVLSDRGPYRVGRVPDGCQAVVVCVAGTAALDLSTGAGDEPVVAASRGVVAAMHLQFATLVWRRTPAGQVELGRVNPYPTLLELGTHVDAVLDALLARFQSC